MTDQNAPTAGAQPQQPPTQEHAAVLVERERIKNESMNASIETYRKSMEVSTTFMNPNVWGQIRAMGKVFFEGKALPNSILNEPQLVMVLQAGFEMGMAPVESLKSLYIVGGTVNVYGPAVVRRLREHGWKVEYTDESDTGVTATVSNLNSGEKYTERYDYVMAEKSGYTKTNSGGEKIGWKAGINRKLKMRYGVLSLIIKSYIPEVLGSASDIAEVAMDAPQQAQELKSAGAPAALPLLHPSGGSVVAPSSFADKMAKKQAEKTQHREPTHFDQENKDIQLTEKVEEK
jgi:hypothetical protein